MVTAYNRSDGITGLFSANFLMTTSGSLAQYFKIVAALSPVLAITTAGDCSKSALLET